MRGAAQLCAEAAGIWSGGVVGGEKLHRICAGDKSAVEREVRAETGEPNEGNASAGAIQEHVVQAIVGRDIQDDLGRGRTKPRQIECG